MYLKMFKTYRSDASEPIQYFSISLMYIKFPDHTLLMYLIHLSGLYVCMCVCVDIRTHPQKKKKKKPVIFLRNSYS